MSETETKTEAQTETKPVAKPKAKKPAPAKKTAKKAPAKKTKAKRDNSGIIEARQERAVDELAEKARDMKVTGKALTERLMQATGLYFVRYRKAQGLTIKTLSEKLGIHSTHACHLESGKRSLLRLDSAVEYAKAIGVKPEALLADIIKLAA